MHLRADGPLIAYFQSVSDAIDTAGLAELDPYGEKVWTPDEAAAMVDRLQNVYDATEALWPRGALGDREPPEAVGGRGGVLAFLFWLRRVFMEAAQRRMFVVAMGD
jgi:hypothetical protein